MVSDVLADGVTGLNHYLTSPTFADMYSGWLRTEVVRVRNEMLALGQFLDCPPPPEGKPYPVGKTGQEYYQHLREQCLKLEAVYPGMYVPDHERLKSQHTEIQLKRPQPVEKAASRCPAASFSVYDLSPAVSPASKDEVVKLLSFKRTLQNTV